MHRAARPGLARPPCLASSYPLLRYSFDAVIRERNLVPPIHELTRAFKGGERSSPKTVLGFFAIMIGIAGTTAVAAIAFIAGVDKLRYLVPVILIVFLVVFLSVMIVVMVLSWKDPSKLMLGQITGRDYVLIQQQKMTLGDSTSGEHVDEVSVEFIRAKALDFDVSIDQPKLLPPEDEDQ